MYWSIDVGGSSTCPECRGRLDRESHAYVLAVRQRGKISLSVVGNDGGCFCRKCPVVVLDHDVFSEFSRLAVRNTNDSQFTVLGLVDFDAVPKEKRDRPFVDPDNPIPLVKFTNLAERGKAPTAALRRRVSGNDYCPCGSGKKFKKCCSLKTDGTANNGVHDSLAPRRGSAS